jgi:hypothetical protein
VCRAVGRLVNANCRETCEPSHGVGGHFPREVFLTFVFFFVGFVGLPDSGSIAAAARAFCFFVAMLTLLSIGSETH